MPKKRDKEALIKRQKENREEKGFLRFDYGTKLGNILDKLRDADVSQLLQTLSIRNDNTLEILDELDKISKEQLDKALKIQDKIINQIVDYKGDLDVEKISAETEEEERLEYAIAEMQGKDHVAFQKLFELVILFLRDKHIGDIKKLISNIEKDQYDLKALARIGEFTGLIAHLVRNPLANILLTAEVLKSKFDENDLRLSYIETIINEVERLDSKIERLVDYKDIKDNKSDISMDEIDINDIISVVIADLQRRFNDRHIKVTTFLSPNLPKIPMVAAKMEEVFLNILHNMIDVLSTGGKINISSQLINNNEEEKDVNQSIVIMLEDTGGGILPEHLDHLFDPGFTTKNEGMGLGLYIAKRFVHEHGGEIKAKNNQKGGATFTITLPVKHSQVNDQECEVDFY